MRKVQITICDRNYYVTCGSDQEDRLKQIVKKLEDNIKSLMDKMESKDFNFALLMTAIMLSDNNEELQNRLNDSKNNQANSMNSDYYCDVSSRIEKILLLMTE